MNQSITDIDFSCLTDILEKNSVKYFSIDADTYDIINNFLEKDVHEEAFFIVDLGKIIRQYAKWKKYMPNVIPYYAVKCNPNPVIIHILNLMGSHFDCASKNEISVVYDLIKDSSKIIFANPVKMCNHIKFARATDVDLMTFDSEQELYKIKLYHPYASLVLRIAVEDTESVISFSEKYGAQKEHIPGILRLIKALKLNLVGVSFHVGTGCLNDTQYESAIRDCRETYNMAKQEGIELNVVDIGGGFPGIDVESKNISFEKIANKIQNAINTHFHEIKDNITFIAEPGRFFVASSHTLVVNIIGKKETTTVNAETGTIEKEFTYYINDGIYGSFNCIYFEKTIPDIQPFNERDGKLYKTKIFGPTCDSIDIIVQETYLPELVVGEWCYIESFGAYTTALASNFNGFSKTQIYYTITN
jgi:ornithine decarboxylase